MAMRVKAMANSSLWPQHLTRCLEHSRCSINLCSRTRYVSSELYMVMTTMYPAGQETPILGDDGGQARLTPAGLNE